VQSLVFSDGTTWSRQDLIDKALNGTSGPDAIYGTPGNDTIDGHAGNDTIVAGNGDDYIIGDTGDDDLTGGSGADTFVFRPGFGHDTIEDFTSSQSDIIEISSSLFVDYNDVMAHATTVGSNVVITYDAADTITLKNMTLANLHATDFHFV
jgi:Ca2+-binding RTX toxin-like protein